MFVCVHGGARVLEVIGPFPFFVVALRWLASSHTESFGFVFGELSLVWLWVGVGRLGVGGGRPWGRRGASPWSGVRAGGRSGGRAPAARGTTKSNRLGCPSGAKIT